MSITSISKKIQQQKGIFCHRVGAPAARANACSTRSMIRMYMFVWVSLLAIITETSASSLASFPTGTGIFHSSKIQQDTDFKYNHEPDNSIPWWSQSAKRDVFQSLLSQSNPILLSLFANNKKSSVKSHNHSQCHSHSQQPDTSLLYRGGSQQHVTVLKKMSKFPRTMAAQIRNYNPPKHLGQYYGLEPDKIFPYQSKSQQQLQDSKTVVDPQVAMANTLTETLEEMKNMRKELQSLRRELYEMRKKITGEQDLTLEGLVQEEEIDPEVTRLAQQKRQRYFDRVGGDIEKWARQHLFNNDVAIDTGWVEVNCNKEVSKYANADGRTKVYVNWMKDSRGKLAFPSDQREYPCIKIYSTLDAPLEDVCTYLSREEHMADYNFILTAQKDLEEIAPHAKICWAASPQVLFIKPREFVTFVCHRWFKDGSVVVLNQACDHKDAPAVIDEGKGKACRGYALRGATFFSPHPQDRQKTKIAMIAHAAPGGDLPQWVSTVLELRYHSA